MIIKNKKITTAILAVIMCFTTSFSIFAADQNNNGYGVYGDFKGLYEAYLSAVENGDISKQAELEAIATATLKKEIQEAEAAVNTNQSSQMLRIDPDRQYYMNLFPTYFTNGYWETRDNGLCLSLFPVWYAPLWSDNKKDEAYNTVYAKFAYSSNWQNSSVMKEQFYCHARALYAMVETDWNLEPWKTSISAFNCN